MKVIVKDLKIQFEPQVTIFVEVTINNVTELLECNEGFPYIMSDLEDSTPGLGGCHLHGKLKEQLTNLGLIRRSTRGSHNRTSLLTREMAREMIAVFEEKFHSICDLNSYEPGESIPTLDKLLIKEAAPCT